MNFNELPLETQLRLILNDLLECRVIGHDCMRFGTATKALESIIEQERSKQKAI